VQYSYLGTPLNPTLLVLTPPPPLILLPEVKHHNEFRSTRRTTAATVRHAMVEKQKSLCKLNISTIISIVCLLCVAVLTIPSFALNIKLILYRFFYKSCKLYKITKIIKNPARKTIDQLDKNSNR
jgi:hypothetical protein